MHREISSTKFEGPVCLLGWPGSFRKERGSLCESRHVPLAVHDERTYGEKPRSSVPSIFHFSASSLHAVGMLTPFGQLLRHGGYDDTKISIWGILGLLRLDLGRLKVLSGT